MQTYSALRALAGTIAVTCLLIGTASAAPAKLTGDTNFLAGPDSKYDTLASLKTGKLVDVIWCGTTDNWCLIVVHNKKGWVPLARLNMHFGSGGATNGTSSGGGGSSGDTAGGKGSTASAGSAAAAAESPPGGGAGMSLQGSGFTEGGGSRSVGGSGMLLGPKNP